MERETFLKTLQVTNPADMSTGCIWENLLKTESALSGSLTLFYAVAVAVALVCTSYLVWQNQKFQLKKQACEESYRLFSIFLFAMHLRVFVPKLCRFLIKYAKPEYVNCEACALLDTFLDVFQVETLTHVCIDRYVIAKYNTKGIVHRSESDKHLNEGNLLATGKSRTTELIFMNVENMEQLSEFLRCSCDETFYDKNGWAINKNHYDMYVYLCLFFSVLYSIPPVFGMGNYALDFDCESCTFDMILPKDWTRFIIVSIWFLRNVKPAFFMLLMLSWTRKLESSFTNEMKIKSDTFFTRIIEIVVTACLTAWAPMAMIRGIVILSQFFYGDLPVYTLEYYGLASTLYEMSPILVTVAVVLANRALNGFQDREVKESNEKQE